MRFKENKVEYARKGVFALLIIFTAILQNTNGLFPKICNVSAMLIVPLVISISMFEREITATFLGLFAGLVWDFYSARMDGFYAVILTVTAFFISYLIKRYMRNNIVTAMVYSGVVSLVTALLYWLFFVLLGSEGGAVMLVYRYLPGVLYTLILTPLYYFFIRMIYIRLSLDNKNTDI